MTRAKVHPNFKAGKPRPKVPTKTQQLKKADQLFGAFVRSRGNCEHCGTTEHLQCAHGFSRRYRAVRFEPANAWALCRGCHVYFTHRPLEWDEWMRNVLGPVRYEAIRVKALTAPNPDLDELIPLLRAQLEGAA